MQVMSWVMTVAGSAEDVWQALFAWRSWSNFVIQKMERQRALA
jgi:hypothetical protein